MEEPLFRPVSKSARMEKRALGFTLQQVLSEELPKQDTPQKALLFVYQLHKLWEFQNDGRGNLFAVTEDDWKSAVEAAISLFPQIKGKVAPLSYFDSRGHRVDVDKSLPPPPKGGVVRGGS